MSKRDDRGVGVRPRAARRRVVRLRATVGRIAANQVQQLRLVAALAAECAEAARAELAGVERGWGVPSEEELTHTTVVHDLQVTLGIAKPAAERLVALATRLVTVLPATLTALEAGRIDLARAEVLSEETAILDDAGARAVQALVLAQVADADGPWQTLSPRSWKSQIQRLVIQADADAARRRREEAIRERAVRAWAQGDGTGVLQIIGQDADIAFADSVLTNLAHAWPATGPDGERLSMDQRRVDGFMDLLRRVAFGDQLPQLRAGRDREVGLVVHSDTLFGDGPAKTRPARSAASAHRLPSTRTPPPSWPAPKLRRVRPPASCSSTPRAPCSARYGSRKPRQAAGPATC
jgi:hypothetical protein